MAFDPVGEALAIGLLTSEFLDQLARGRVVIACVSFDTVPAQHVVAKLDSRAATSADLKWENTPSGGGIERVAKKVGRFPVCKEAS